ncbi:MAG: MoaD/ThiS family protein [Candidatus Thorarchaeota archaeon]
MSSMLSKTHRRKLIVTERKTVSELLVELDLSDDHFVLVGGKKVGLDYQLQENESVVILPRIAGG